MARKKIGALLEEKGYINEFQLVAALSHQRKWKSKLGQSLIELGYLEEDKLFEVLAEQLELPFVNLKGMQVAPEILRRVTKDFAREWLAVPISYDGAAWSVAVCEPDKPNLTVVLSNTLNGPVKLSLATPTAIETLTRKIPDKVAVGTVQPVKKAFVRNGNGAYVPAPDNGLPIVGDPTPPPRPAPLPQPVMAPAPTTDDFFAMPEDAPPTVSEADTPLDVGDILSPPEPAAEEEILAMPDEELALPVEEPTALDAAPVETIEAPALDLPSMEPAGGLDLPPMPTDDGLRLEEPVEEPVAMPAEDLALPVEEPLEMPPAAPEMELEAPSLDLPPIEEAGGLDLPPMPPGDEPAVLEAPSLTLEDEPLAMPGEELEAPPVMETDAGAAPELPDLEPMELEPDFQGGSAPVDAGEGEKLELEPAYESGTFSTGEEEPVPMEAPNETAAAMAGDSDSEAMSLDEILPPPTEPMELETSSAPPLGDELPELGLPDDGGLPPAVDDQVTPMETMELEPPGPPPMADGVPEFNLPDDAPLPPVVEESAPPIDLQPPDWSAPPAAEASNVFDTAGLFDSEPPPADVPGVPPMPPEELEAPPELETPALEVPELQPAEPELTAVEPPPELGDEVMEIPEPGPPPEAVVAEPEADAPPDEDTVALMNQIKALETQISGMNGVLENLKGMLKDRKGKKK